MAAPLRRPHHATGFGNAVRKFLVGIGVMLVVAVLVAGGLLYWELTTNLPPIEKLAQYRPAIATQILADDGSVIGEFYLEKRYLVPIEQIPPLVRNAFIAAEDDGFYQHKGVDPVSILRALVNNTVAGGKVQGGSTITQQVVKALLLSPQKSYERKLKEMVLAMRMERQLSKDQILYLYLNSIYLGSGAYGVAAAAQEYFGKRVEDLDLAETALLAGLPQAPSRYSPFKHWPRAKARQRYVLQRMADSHVISADDAEAAAHEPLALASRKGSFIAAPYYVEHVRRLLDEKYGNTALYALGLRVHTAANRRLQAAAEAALRSGMDELAVRERYDATPRHLSAADANAFIARQQEQFADRGLERLRTYDAVVVASPAAAAAVKPANARRSAAPSPPTRATAIKVQVGTFRGPLVLEPGAAPSPTYQVGDLLRVRVAESTGLPGGYRFRLDRQPPMQGALVALDPATGNVKAMVGGYDFDSSVFNRATQSARQPGSAFKPLVYAAALEREFTPATVIVDEPITFNDKNGTWMPQNYEERFFGPTTLRDALTFSRNVVTVKLATRIGVKRLVEFVKQIGIRGPLKPNLSLALGSSEVTLLELAAAYSAFANLGQRAEPRFITRITDSQGNVLDDALPHIEQVMSPEAAYMITSILQGVIDHGTGKRAKGIGRPAAGKTGTTNDMNDAWFIGYAPQLLTGVWIGFDEKRSLGKGETGGRVAAPIWLRFMERALEPEPMLDFPVPASIRFVPINPHNGRRALPGDAGARLECFRQGTEPAAVSVEAAAAAPEPPEALRDAAVDAD